MRDAIDTLFEKGDNCPQTLSGIETLRLIAKLQAEQATIALKPFQGLKPLERE